MSTVAAGITQPSQSLKLDRIAIEEAGPNPEKLALAVLAQLGPVSKAIPIAAIAQALDIIEIRYEELESFEGALLTTEERDVGSILINANASTSHQRQRFTLAHELGHFLNPWHTPHSEEGFMCSKNDVQFGGFRIKPGLSRHEVQELEANRFAIKLLAPKSLVERMSSDEPSMEDLLNIATTLDLSKSSAARRYVELHFARVAVVFTQHGRVLYSVTSSGCPRIILNKGDPLVRLHSIAAKDTVTDEIDLEVRKGTYPNFQITAYAETLYQQGGFAMTLLDFEPDQEDLDGDEDQE